MLENISFLTDGNLVEFLSNDLHVLHETTGTSLVVQGLETLPVNVRVAGSVPGWELRFHVPQGTAENEK